MFLVQIVLRSICFFFSSHSGMENPADFMGKVEDPSGVNTATDPLTRLVKAQNLSIDVL